MSKQNNFIWITIIIFAVVIVLGIGAVFLFFSPFSQSIVQGGFDCPANKFCTATPILKCTVGQSNQRVILRTNAPTWAKESFNLNGVWIVLDANGDGALEGYVKGTQTINCLKDSPSSINFFKNNANAGNIDFIYQDSHGKIRACFSDVQAVEYKPDTQHDCNCHQVQTDSTCVHSSCCGSSCIYNNCCSLSPVYSTVCDKCNDITDTTLSPVPAFSGKEKYQGGLYSCSIIVSIAGDIKETLYWTDATNQTPPEGIRGNTYTLTGGQSMSATGTGAFEVEYTINDIPITTCTASDGTVLEMGDAVCINPYLLEKCENINNKPTLSTQNAIPPKVCRDGDITDAYNVEITIPKLVIAKSEKLNIDFYLKDTPNNKNIDVTASITKPNFNPLSQTHTTGSTYTTAGRTSFTFDAPPIGYYTVKIAFIHPDGDFSKEYNLQVTDDLTLVLTTANQIQFDSSAPEITLNSFKSGSSKDLTNWVLDATYNGVKVTEWITEHPNLGSRKFIFTTLKGKGDGMLRIRAKGQDESGLWTEFTDYFDITVKKASIIIIANFESDKCMGFLTQNFEVKDSLGNYVGTTNTIKIDKPLGGTDSVSATGSNGKYSFSYTYIEGGTYTIRITSTHPTLGSSQLNSGQGQIVNILTGSACQAGGCEGISCYTNWIIFGGVAVAIGLFVYFVFFFRRKK